MTGRAFAGLAIARRLFFAEAKHAVTLYHDGGAAAQVRRASRG